MNTFFNESPKCHLYRYIFDNNVLQFYFDRPLNYIYKPYICKMRISAHNLNIETGRFYYLDQFTYKKIYMVNILRYTDIIKTIFKKNISYFACPV
jgi:hypothetical protein